MISFPHRRRRCVPLLALFLVVTLPGAPEAKTFCLPHVLEASGTTSSTPYTFDTTIFMTYAPGQAGSVDGGGAAADLYLFANDGTPMSNNGAAVCAPCSYALDSSNRKVSIRVDDLITAQGGTFDAGVKLGFGVLVVGGPDPEGVAVQSFVVNSHTSAFDVSIAEMGPQALGHLCDEAQAGDAVRTYVLPHVLEQQGRITNTQFTFDTTIYMAYTGGLAGIPAGPTGASADLYLYDEDGNAMLGTGGGAVCAPCTFNLDAGTRKVQASIETLFENAGGMPAAVALGYGVVVVNGEPDHVNLQGFVVNSHTSAFDLSVFGFEPQEIAAPGRTPVSPGDYVSEEMSVVPNPSQAGTTLRFALARPTRVELAIYDVQGRKVAELWNGRLEEGPRAMTWDGRIDGGAGAPAGVYFARLTGDGVSLRNRIVTIR